jgi:hypothetical protein
MDRCLVRDDRDEDQKQRPSHGRCAETRRNSERVDSGHLISGRCRLLSAQAVASAVMMTTMRTTWLRRRL